MGLLWYYFRESFRLLVFGVIFGIYIGRNLDAPHSEKSLWWCALLCNWIPRVFHSKHHKTHVETTIRMIISLFLTRLNKNINPWFLCRYWVLLGLHVLFTGFFDTFLGTVAYNIVIHVSKLFKSVRICS